MPLVRPDTLYEVTRPVFGANVVHVELLVDCSTLYPVTADPPFDVGADQSRVACVLPAVADNAAGASATPNGITSVVESTP
ncbi:unannotated protein [freshwater metagenome]|uniref:Unannotated protein n=1 Tax=freshwater metagenome TaxID=449393 RepID=A0A6J6ECD2_9ZZZZ